MRARQRGLRPGGGQGLWRYALVSNPVPPLPQFQPPPTRQRPGAGGAKGERLASGPACGLSRRQWCPGLGLRSVPSPGDAGAAGAGRGLAWERR